MSAADRVTFEDVAALADADASQFAPDQPWTFHRIQDGYADGIPRAVFLNSEDEPTGIPLIRDVAVVMTLAINLARLHDAASSALVALGQADDGRTLAERIGAHTETMRHLSIARADVAIIHEALAVTPGETAIGAARRARSTIETLRAEVARLTKAKAECLEIAERATRQRDEAERTRDALREKARAVCELEWEGAWRLSDDDTLLFSALRAEVDR